MVEKLKQNNKLLIPLIIVGIVLIFGITYAWLSQVISGTKVNKITVGALSLVMDDETSNGINIENGLPQTNAQGLNNDAYTFSVENSGAGSAVYKLFLEDEEIETERIADTNIKFNITRNGDTIKEGLLTTSVVEGRRELDSILIKEGETNNYSLRLWIDQESTQSEVGGKTFKAKIKLEGTQAQEASTLSLSEDSEIEEGETHTFNVEVTPSLSDTANIKWCSNSNTIISGATAQGRCNEGEYEITSCYGNTSCEVEGTNGGEATITVRTRNISDSARLIINTKDLILYDGSKGIMSMIPNTGARNNSSTTVEASLIKKDVDLTNYSKIIVSAQTTSLINGSGVWLRLYDNQYNNNLTEDYLELDIQNTITNAPTDLMIDVSNYTGNYQIRVGTGCGGTGHDPTVTDFGTYYEVVAPGLASEGERRGRIYKIYLVK